ncbi:DEAD/DEAH box helicase [Neokomagataea anthophila]|nr:DEAD/DEAH box helicase [Neokomagataea anthophila]
MTPPLFFFRQQALPNCLQGASFGKMHTMTISNVSSPSVSFEGLGLAPALLAALESAGHKRPSLIQARAIPPLLKGKDVLIASQTGSGKTAAFVLPLLQALARRKEEGLETQGPWALILEPTRELAAQAASVCRQLGRRLPLKTRVICGGTPRDQQLRGLADGVDIIVATHGRLLDLVVQGDLVIDQIGYLVLDEADRLLDDEFTDSMTALSTHFPDIQPQTVFCSATLPAPVMDLAKRVTQDPVRIELETEDAAPQRIRQRAMFVLKDDKVPTIKHVLNHFTGRTMVFVQTKQGAETLGRSLSRSGVSVETLHGDRTQGARARALTRFREGQVQVLVTTDIAARGIDIPDVECVINADMPSSVPAYIHRIGRTARAGKRGIALSLLDPQERHLLRDVEKETGQRVRIVTEETLDR